MLQAEQKTEDDHPSLLSSFGQWFTYEPVETEPNEHVVEVLPI